MSVCFAARLERAASAVAVLALCACSGAFGGNARETVHQAIGAGPAPAVHLENVAGTVRIEAWHKPIVDVEATKYGHDAEDLRNIAVSVRKEASGIYIVTSYTGGTHSGGVRYRVFVPADASLRIDNVAGAIKLEGVRGDVVVQTQAGTITADLGKVAGDRSIDLRATTGAIALWIAPDSSSIVEASSTVGAFASNLPGLSQSRENLVGAHASGKIGSGSGRIRLTTTTGAIALRERPI
jgi:DUF4097 and DUF4098 domain-containing protein YvlB